jgi:2-oxoisovalerate dehydrogenase E1 component
MAPPNVVELRAVLDRYEGELLQAFTIRTVEAKLLELFRQGLVSGTVHTCIGQELSAVLVAKHLEARDVVLSNHRCHGHYLARTGDVRGLVAEVMGKASGVSRGLGGSQHLSADGFFSNGIQGGIVPVAAGIALHHKLAGTGAISVAYLGDGTFGEGAVYEAFNIASKWQLPALFVVEDNAYAQSTASHQTLAGTYQARAEAFGIPYLESSIWDLPQLDEAVREAVTRVRRDSCPVILRVRLYRLEAHSRGDDDRDRAEIEAYRAIDPLTVFVNEHRAHDRLRPAMDAAAAELEAVVASLLDEGVSALSFPAPPPGEAATAPAVLEPLPQAQAINQSLARFLDREPRGVVIGEDIHSPYGGAFKVCNGLSDRFPGRVLTTPISEAAIAGIANGLALMGTPVVAEIMFGDFITLAFDQIVNHAAKFKLMYGDDRSMRIVFRTPMGGGRGYGPTHSQSLEKHLVGIPGTEVFILHGRARAGAFYDTLLARSTTPAIVIENKLLYARRGDRSPPPHHEILETDEPYPATVLRPAGPPDITLVAFGNTSDLAELVATRLFEEEEIAVELVFVLRASPLAAEPILGSARRTGRVVVVEEGPGGYDLGAEVIATVTTSWPPGAPLAVRRLAARPMAIPCSKPLEEQVLPSADELYALCLDVFAC